MLFVMKLIFAVFLDHWTCSREKMSNAGRLLMWCHLFVTNMSECMSSSRVPLPPYVVCRRVFCALTYLKHGTPPLCCRCRCLSGSLFEFCVILVERRYDFGRFFLLSLLTFSLFCRPHFSPHVVQETPHPRSGNAAHPSNPPQPPPPPRPPHSFFLLLF